MAMEALEEEMGVPAEAGDEPSASADRYTATAASAGVVPHRLIDIPTSTGGDGREGSCVATDI